MFKPYNMVKNSFLLFGQFCGFSGSSGPSNTTCKTRDQQIGLHLLWSLSSITDRPLEQTLTLRTEGKGRCDDTHGVIWVFLLLCHWS